MGAARTLARVVLLLSLFAGQAPVATTSVAASTPPADPLDVQLGSERSLLSFLPDHVRSGRYAFRRSHPDRYESPQTRVRRGVFWRTASGNAYTRHEPYDEALVARLVEPVVRRARTRYAKALAREKPEPGDGDIRKFLPLLGGDFYRGSEYQYTLFGTLYVLLLPRIEGTSLYDADERCARAFDAHYAVARNAVAALRPQFVAHGARDRWYVDVTALREDTAASRRGAERACGRDELAAYDPEPPRRLAIERWDRGVAVLDPDDPESRPQVVEVTPGDVGPPPAEPRRDHGDPSVLAFLLAVNACRSLPWEYSNFAAADSYTSPGSRYYNGPNPFMGRWVCEQDVPDDERRQELSRL